jgi:TrmH family RNA methyltransferase
VWRDNVVFIVVRPIFLGNIGSTARVLKNFGFRKLRFVQPPRTYKDSEARRMSVGAFDLLKASEVFDSLEEAAKDVSIAIGTTSGQQRGEEPSLLEAVVPKLIAAAPQNLVAFIFGDERDGLTRAELERCHYQVRIPTESTFAALNMAQAVAICAYELIRSSNSVPSAEVSLTTGSNDDELFEQVERLLDKVEFSRKFNRAVVLSELRQFYQRAHPTDREFDLLKGALHKINARLADPDSCG